MTWPILFSACNNSVIYTDSKIIDNSSWKEKDTISFTFNIADTTHYYDLNTVIRLNTDYEFRNMYIKTTLLGPRRQKVEELRNFKITDIEGKWLGSGMGKLKEYELPLFKKLELHDEGDYTIEMIQYFRFQSIAGVEDIGLSVKKLNEVY